MPKAKTKRLRNAAILCVVAAVWLILDQVSKAACDAFSPGQTFNAGIPGVLDLTLEHNTGAAWGMFSDSTGPLAALSIVVCVAAIAYLMLAPQLPLCGVFGLSLVVAGGAGNAIDRIVHGYVIDFLRPTFIDFPIFNIADIGVTCGVALFIIALIIEWAREAKA